MDNLRYYNQTGPFWDFISTGEGKDLATNFMKAFAGPSAEREERNMDVEDPEEEDITAAEADAEGAFGAPEASPWDEGGWAQAWAFDGRRGGRGGGRGRGRRGPPPFGRAFPHHGPPPPHGGHSHDHHGPPPPPGGHSRDHHGPPPPHGEPFSHDHHGPPPPGHHHGKEKEHRGGSPHEDGPRREHSHERGHHGPGPGPHGQKHGHGGHGRCGRGGCGEKRGRGGPGAFGMGGGPFNMANLAEFLQSQVFGGVEGASDDKEATKGNEDFVPPVDIFDTEAAFVVHVSLPGAKKEDIGVHWDAEKSEVNISGVIHRPGDEAFLKTLALDERKVGAFTRKVKLGSRASPATVDAEGISAKLEDGILRLTVPKEDKEFDVIHKIDIE